MVPEAEIQTAITTVAWIYLACVFLFTAAISVVTGGTSLITVPVMMQFGVEPHVAVATNMLALTFLSAGGTLPFIKSRSLSCERLPALSVLTLTGSILGAFLLLLVPSGAIPLVIATAMIVVAAFSMVNRNAGLSVPSEPPRHAFVAAGYASTFLLGIYGGFFSGGYVALLTASYVAFFRLTFLEAVAVTKVLNFASSLVASAIFAAERIIDWELGIFLGVVSFLGAVVGAEVARRLSNIWLRRFFLTSVIVLALKLLVVDIACGR